MENKILNGLTSLCQVHLIEKRKIVDSKHIQFQLRCKEPLSKDQEVNVTEVESLETSVKIDNADPYLPSRQPRAFAPLLTAPNCPSSSNLLHGVDGEFHTVMPSAATPVGCFVPTRGPPTVQNIHNMGTSLATSDALFIRAILIRTLVRRTRLPRKFRSGILVISWLRQGRSKRVVLCAPLRFRRRPSCH